MLSLRVLKVTLILVFAGLTAMVATAQDDAGIQAKIGNAMSAAPVAIAADATIVDWEFDAEGNFVALREGTNGWTCLPDELATPVNNPICFDEAALQWFYALLTGEEPNLTIPGFTYQMQGDEGFSNSDPYATEPAEDHWSSTAPYMMVIFPAGVDLSSYTSDHHSTGPFVMWGDTPYKHIMIPVGDADPDE